MGARRHFSVSSTTRGHYQTLNVPKNASVNQIKSNYFKLSKLYHPDRNSDPKATTKFHAISEAYSVLIDDQKRRAYDRTLQQSQHSNSPNSNPSSYDELGHLYNLRRHAGAKHAWQRPRSRPGQHYTPPPPSGGGSQHHNHGFRAHDHFAHTRYNRDRATRRQEHTTDEDRVEHVSSLWRAVGVVGLVFLINTIAGGWSASAV
ncbi:DnaJ-domain-containing protein [Rickenella mellea]|uniref:DnaJ-domain-containing protein n=1 Tax=Rickenella mellea TaxID=50990 RepID=A0A4Y7Q081_9AGAM|nr:DnaJ-domain-containing protein [Rickenella mellea]